MTDEARSRCTISYSGQDGSNLRSRLPIVGRYDFVIIGDLELLHFSLLFEVKNSSNTDIINSSRLISELLGC